MKKFNIIKSITVILSLAVVTTSLSGCNLSKIASRIFNSGKRMTSRISSEIDNLEKKSKDERKVTFSGYCYNTLDSEVLQDIYTEIDDYINRTSSEEMCFDSNVTLKLFDEALEAYTNDHPEVFWINEASRYTYYTVGEDLYIEFSFTFKNEELINAKSELKYAVAKALEQAPDNATDYEIELFINDYIVDNCEYITDADMCHNAYGALVNKEAVCDGYSKAFQLLCGELGIDCIVIQGESAVFDEKTDTDTQSMTGHMWNCIKLEDNWYHVDVTWNDIDDKAEFYIDTERYFYLNLTTNQIENDHKINPLFSEEYKINSGINYNIFIPECTSEEYNYFKHSCICIYDIDNAEELIDRLAYTAAEYGKYFDFIIDESLDYNDTVDSIVKGYAYNWIESANSYNGYNPQINPVGNAYTYEKLRLVTLVLEYY